MPSLQAVATAVPENQVRQAEIEELAVPLFIEAHPELEPYLPVFGNTGIDTRHFALPVEAYLEPMGWKQRNQHFADVGLELMTEATHKVLAEADLGPRDIDGIVLVSTTGIAAPSLDARLLERLGMRRDVHRVPVWGLGCAGGVAGLRLAADLADARPGKRYLVMALELCSLSFRLDDTSVRAFVANAIFADGCAAAIVTRQAEPDGRPVIGQTQSYQWPDSQDVMGWNIEDEGMGVIFSRSIPEILKSDLAPVVSALASPDDPPDRYVLHPGGAKVLDAYQEALGLRDEDLREERQVLRDYGNMSSPTVLFVLQEAMRDPFQDGEQAFMAAVGPGFSAEMALLRGTAATPAHVEPQRMAPMKV